MFPKTPTPQPVESLQPRCVRQASIFSHQPHRRRRRAGWKQSRGNRGAAVQSEGCSPPAVLPACAPQSLWALLSNWLSLQTPAGCHHLCQPPAAQVNSLLPPLFAAIRWQTAPVVPVQWSPFFRTRLTCCICVFASYFASSKLGTPPLFKMNAVFVWDVNLIPLHISTSWKGENSWKYGASKPSVKALFLNMRKMQDEISEMFNQLYIPAYFLVWPYLGKAFSNQT